MVPTQIFGRNTVPTTSFTDVWSKGGTAVVRTLPAAAVVLGISSSSTADDVGSTGALTVKVEGLDSTWAYQTETISMDGRSKVVTANSYLRVNKLTMMTAGSGGTNAGVIYAYDTSDTVTNGVPQTATKIFATIEVGEGVSLMGMYSVPLGESKSIKRVIATVADHNATARFGKLQLQVRLFGEAWTTYIPMGLSNMTSDIVLEHPIALPAKTDFRFQATASAAGEITVIVELDNA